MRSNPNRQGSLLVRGVVVFASLAIANGAPGAGNLTDSPTIADLIYDPVTGNVKMDASEAAGAKITFFSLDNFVGNPTGPFIPANYISLAGIGAFGGVPFFQQVTPNLISDTDSSHTGFTGIHNFGNIFPAGLSQTCLQAYLKTASYIGESGSGQFQLDLVVSGPPFVLRMVDVARNGSELTFIWTSRCGKTYALVSSTDLSTAPASWAVYDPVGPPGPYSGIAPSGTGQNTLSGVPLSGPRRYFAVRESN